MRVLGQRRQSNSVSGEHSRDQLGLPGKAVRLLLYLALVLFLALGGRQLFATAIDDAICALTNCQPSGPPSSWAAQATAMKQAVEEHSEEPARLSHIVAVPRSGSRRAWDLNQALEVKAEFELQSGGDITLSYLDTDPAKTIHKVEWTTPRDSDMPMQPEARLSDSLSAIKVSPREAVSLTWPTASERAQRAQLAVFPSLTLFSDESSWRVLYISSQEATPGDVGRYRIVSEFEVNAQTGDFAERR
jgi:hypothetical protein